MSKIEFYGNLSWSAFNLFRECERRFFYEKVLKIKATDYVESKYGDFGNVVHLALEKIDEFDSPEEAVNFYWDRYKLMNKMDINVAYKCVKYGLSFNFNFKHKEQIILFDWLGMKVKLIIDGRLQDDSILDWKTSTYDSKKVDDYKEQLKWYAWGVWKNEGVIPPKCILIFNKAEKVFEWSFSEDELIQFELNIIKTLKKLSTKKKFDDFDPNYKACYFCAYKKQCMSDQIQEKNEMEFKINIDHDYITLVTPINDNNFHKIMSELFSYEMDGAEFVRKAMQAKGSRFDGIVRMWDWKSQKIPLGFYHRFVELLKQYAESLGNRALIIEDDIRIFDKKIIDYNLKLPYQPRQYQVDASNHIKYKKISMTEIATGAGKTTIAALLINEVKCKTLYVVDRNVLLSQTKNEFEKMFGEEIGTVTEGKQNWKNITIASIQTLNKLIDKNNSECINNVSLSNLVIVDEAHGAKSKSYKKLFTKVGAEYRVALTATPYSDGNDSLELYRTFGFPDFKISTKDLINEGFLVMPEIRFLKYDSGFIMNGTYNEVYDQILESDGRINKLVEVVKEYEGKNVLIMANKIDHMERIWKELSSFATPMVIKGDVKAENRDKIIKEMKSGTSNIIIGTASIVQKGIDIPNLDVIINYSANLGTITTKQSLGRVLRLYEGKETAYYIDFYDDQFSLLSHTKERIKTLQEQGFEVLVE